MTAQKPADVSILQRALEDELAKAPDDFWRMEIVHAWIMVGVAQIAREKGRAGTLIALRNFAAWVKTAEPADRWPD